MNSINQRLDIFLQTNIITLEERNILEKWVEIIEDYSNEINMEKLERLITHSAMMMQRQREDTTFSDLPKEIYKTIQEHELYKDSVSLFRKMNNLYKVNSKEEKYLILHLCSLFTKE